jgi:hypothetical protein
MSVFNDNRRYLMVVAILILVAFCVYFNYAFRSHENTLVREMAHEKQQDVGLIGGIIDKLVYLEDKTGIGRDFESVLIFAVEYIEANYHSTFAQVFDEQLNPLIPLHPGVGGGRKHNPLDYPEFIRAVNNNEYGDLVYHYETEEAGGRDVYMTFRWVPTDANHTPRYLVAVGISKYTINEQIDTRVIYGAIALIIISAVFIIGGAVLIIKLGYIWDMREGDKWRRKW